MSKVPVKDYPGYFRDEQSYGIVNDNDVEYQEYMKRKSAKQKEAEEKAFLNSRINNLENQVGQLKNGIDQILELLTNGPKNTTTKDS
jgi:hypothetical protein